MSTVLWANTLSDACVRSDESDKPALCRHMDTLDSICLRIGIPSFKGICDSTDLRVNLGHTELPAGLISSNELMAINGAWIDAQEAVQALTSLLAEIQSRNIRFGLLRNDQAAVVAELQESIAFAKRADAGAKFNFSVVA